MVAFRNYNIAKAARRVLTIKQTITIQSKNTLEKPFWKNYRAN